MCIFLDKKSYKNRSYFVQKKIKQVYYLTIETRQQKPDQVLKNLGQLKQQYISEIDFLHISLAISSLPIRQDRFKRLHSNYRRNNFAPANPENVLHEKLSNMFEKILQTVNKAVERFFVKNMVLHHIFFILILKNCVLWLLKWSGIRENQFQ